jgi:hypothetical protein
MITRVFLSLALLVAIPAWPQVSTTDGGIGLAMTDQMQTPPPVNDGTSSTETGYETRSNYLGAGLKVGAAYSDNVLSDVSNPVGDVDYSFYPTLVIDKGTPRYDLRLNYNPSFTIYQHTSSQNQADQYVALHFQYRLSPHVTLSLQDSLLETSNVLNKSDPFAGAGISGSPQTPADAIIVPVAGQLINGANAELTYQFTRSGMIGASGIFTNLHYFHPEQVLGVYDSNSSGGAAFYSHRLSGRHYIGLTYRYSKILAYPVNAQSEIQAQSIFFFYTVYLKPTFSLSFSGGPQHYEVVQFPLASYSSWSPNFTASTSWLGRHTNFAASYARVVTGGGGLVGAFRSDRASGFARWQLARTWNIGVVGNYANNKNVTPSGFISTQGGHSIFGTLLAQHQLSEHLFVEFGYTRLQQSYGIPVISKAPITNRESISFSYNFLKPLGG